MSPLLLKIISLIITGMAIWGLISGKIMAGSRGLQPNYYTKQDSPFLYYCFICIYLLIGVFLLLKVF